MTSHEPKADLVRQARRLHDETPHGFRTSTTLSIDTRDRLGEIRDELNGRLDERMLDTDDVVRLALRGAAAYHGTTDDDPADIGTLTAVIHETAEKE
jgi:hypothetical protein